MKAATLASRVRARYARYESLVNAPSMSLAAAAAPVTLHPQHHHAQFLCWAPRIDLVAARSAGRHTGARATLPPGHVRRERIETVVRGIVSRIERVEALAAPHMASSVARPTASPRDALWSDRSPGGAVPRVFQKASRVAVPAHAMTTTSPAPAANAPAEAARWPGWPPGRTAALPPAVDVERLTDQVAQALGRRISAHHERRGR